MMKKILFVQYIVCVSILLLFSSCYAFASYSTRDIPEESSPIHERRYVRSQMRKQWIKMEEYRQDVRYIKNKIATSFMLVMWGFMLCITGHLIGVFKKEVSKAFLSLGMAILGLPVILLKHMKDKRDDTRDGVDKLSKKVKEIYPSSDEEASDQE